MYFSVMDSLWDVELHLIGTINVSTTYFKYVASYNGM